MSTEVEQSKIIESSEESQDPKLQEEGIKFSTCVLIGVVLFIVVMIMWNSYAQFKANQNCPENFIEKTIKSGPDDDHVFDVETEVNKLRKIQENYLFKIRQTP